MPVTKDAALSGFGSVPIALLLLFGCGADDFKPSVPQATLSGWDDTYLSLRAPLFSLNSGWGYVDADRQQLNCFSNRLHLMETVNRSFEGRAPLRMVRIERKGIVDPWECVWLVQYATNVSACYYATSRGDQSTVPRDRTDLLQNFAELRTSMVYTVSEETFNRMWSFLEHQSVWQIHSDSQDSFDGTSYFISVYDHGKSRQIASHGLDSHSRNAERIKVLVQAVTSEFAGDLPMLTEEWFVSLNQEHWLATGSVLTGMHCGTSDVGLLGKFAVFDSTVLSSGTDLLVVRDDDYGLLCRIRRAKRRPFACPTGTPARVRVFGLTREVDCTNKTVTIDGQDLKYLSGSTDITQQGGNPWESTLP